MSAALDKSLDEIIGANKRPARARITNARRATGPRRTSKQVVPVRRATVSNARVARARQARPAAPVNAIQRVANLLQNAKAARVSVEGLPRDIKQDAVREFFSSQVGGVQRVLLSYNERGNSTGIATITLKNAEMAKKAIQKFNGAPIDGGRTKLKLNLIIDPTQQPVRTLNDRIQPLQRQPLRQPLRQPQKQPQRQTQRQPQRLPQRQPQKRAPTPKAAKAKARKQQKPVKKSLEDLDKEMADYFEEKN